MIKVQENELKAKLGDLFNNRSSEGVVSRPNLKKFNPSSRKWEEDKWEKKTLNQQLKKFKSAWNLIDNFDPDNLFEIPMEDQLRRFLSMDGDCKHYKYILACIFFQCHTDSSIAYIKKSLKDNKNLQNRAPLDFAFDLVCGWIFELFLFNNFGVQKSGCDSDYILQKGKSINFGADFTLGNQKIELSADNTGISCDRNHLHLRWDKWEAILEEEMYLLVLCPNHLKYYLYHGHHLNKHLNVEWVDRIDAFSKDEDVPGYKLSGWKNLKVFDLNHSNLQKHFNYIEHGIIE